MNGVVTLKEAWGILLSIVGFISIYMIKKRDKDIDDLKEKQNLLEREDNRIELKMSDNFATKDSLRNLFNETQNYQRESSGRLEKQIDETKAEVRSTNANMVAMTTAILNKLDSK